MAYAQTNIQLYNQLCQSNWSFADLRHVHAAYGLALSIFSGHFRPNHKPFLAHLVGTASILAEHDAEPTVAIAGLLHSIYGQGEFGDGSRGINPRKRRQVRSTVGSVCEDLIALYHELPWTESKLEYLVSNSGRLSALESAAALIKLADILEDHTDLGLQYSPNQPASSAAGETRQSRDCFIELAHSLGHPSLAGELDAVFAAAETCQVPDFLRAAQPGSFLLAPVSHRMRASVKLGGVYRRWRDKLSPFGKPSHKQAA